MTDIVVIGAGLAGLIAAIRLQQAGARVQVVTKGLGGLQLSQGTVDILGYAPDRVDHPFEALPSFIDANPDHPYATIGVQAVRTGVDYFAELVGKELIVGDPTTNVFLPTAVGALRPTALVQPSMSAGVLAPDAKVVVVGSHQLKDFAPELIAANLARYLPNGSARAARINYIPRDGEHDPSGLTVARSLDSAAKRERFAQLVAEQVKPGEIVALPGVLGLHDLSAWRQIADIIGQPIFEIPLPPPGVPGMRLNEALNTILKKSHPRIWFGSAVVGCDANNGRLRSVTVAASGAPQKVRADAFVLANGGFESGALSLDSYGQLTETALGLPVRVPQGDLIRADYWGPQPLFQAGLAVDEAMRPLDPATGSVIYDNLFAAGGILAGAQRWSEKSGEGIALGSAVRASDAIVEAM